MITRQHRANGKEGPGLLPRDTLTHEYLFTSGGSGTFWKRGKDLPMYTGGLHNSHGGDPADTCLEGVDKLFYRMSGLKHGQVVLPNVGIKTKDTEQPYRTVKNGSPA